MGRQEFPPDSVPAIVSVSSRAWDQSWPCSQNRMVIFKAFTPEPALAEAKENIYKSWEWITLWVNATWRHAEKTRTFTNRTNKIPFCFSWINIAKWTLNWEKEKIEQYRTECWHILICEFCIYKVYTVTTSLSSGHTLLKLRLKPQSHPTYDHLTTATNSNGMRSPGPSANFAILIGRRQTCNCLHLCDILATAVHQLQVIVQLLYNSPS